MNIKWNLDGFLLTNLFLAVDDLRFGGTLLSAHARKFAMNCEWTGVETELER